MYFRQGIAQKLLVVIKIKFLFFGIIIGWSASRGVSGITILVDGTDLKILK